MTIAQFWEIMNATRGSFDCQTQSKTLRDKLRTLPPEQVVEFQSCLNELLYQSYTSELWGAAHLINGTCSESTFHFFRAWLIGQGQDVFETALINPDSLSQLDLEESLCEELLYVAYSVYQEMTGQEMQLEKLPLPELILDLNLENPEDVAGRYPRLSGLFGQYYILGSPAVAHQVLQKCRSQYTKTIDHASLWDKFTYLYLRKPLWLHWDDHDKLHGFYHAAPKLFENGRVVWGHIVQANALLFKEGKSNCPAELVFSLDPRVDKNPEFLTLTAECLFELKGTEPDDEALAPFAEHLTDEMTRRFGVEVPLQLSGNVPCVLSTTMVFRKHLPNGMLSQSLMPILVDPDNPQAALILPARFWPKDLEHWWMRGE